jgi:hypothetical protein
MKRACDRDVPALPPLLSGPAATRRSASACGDDGRGGRRARRRRPSGPLHATGYAHSPGYEHGAGGSEDYAVVLFDGEDTLPGPFATLPGAGQLDRMRKAGELRGFVFDRVGYGAATQFQQGPPQILWGEGIRQETTMPYAALTSITLLTQGNVEKTDLGGTCFGDSGSPVLGSEASGYEDVVFAVTSWGDAKCRAIDHALRLDTASAQQFLQTSCEDRGCTFHE